jgi:hypothetical protein
MGNARGLERVRQAGVPMRVQIIGLSVLASLAALISIESIDSLWTTPVGLIIIGSLAISLWSLRIGIWADQRIMMFRSFARTVVLPRATISIRVAPFAGAILFIHGTRFLTMLVVDDGSHEYEFQFTMTTRKRARHLAHFLQHGNLEIPPPSPRRH